MNGIPKSKKVYCLVDCDSFYASCEVLRNPKLQGKCVCVGREADIIVASSYEAKRYGVKTGTASRDAKKILGNKMVLIEPDFGWYAEVSKRLQQLLQDFCLDIEVFSIDECFVEVTGYAERYGLSREKFAYYLKLKIKKEIGIPVSIGVGRSKIVAKLLSDYHKPYGQCSGVEEGTLQRIYIELDIGEVCYIGDKSREKIKSYCKNISQFIQIDYKTVKKLLGLGGLKVWMELQGWDVLSFALPPIPKNITRSKSFHPHFTKDPDKARIHLLHNVDTAYDEMMKHQLGTRYIRVRLRDKDFCSHSREYYLPYHCNDKRVLLKHIKKLFDEAMKADVEWRTTGIIFGELKDTRYVPTGDLFSFHTDMQQEKIYKAKQVLEAKFGKEVIMSTSSVQLGLKKKYALESFCAFEAV